MLEGEDQKRDGQQGTPERKTRQTRVTLCSIVKEVGVRQGWGTGGEKKRFIKKGTGEVKAKTPTGLKNQLKP